MQKESGQTGSRPLLFIPFDRGRTGTAFWKVLQASGQETGRVGWRWMKIHLSTSPYKEMLAGRILPREKGSIICGGETAPDATIHYILKG